MIIADGSVRSGKTVSMSLSYVQWSMDTFDGENLGMSGKTIGSFRRNVLTPLKRMLKALKYRVKDHRADNMVEISKGRKTNFYYIFGGKDERSQDLIQGITLAGMLFDEVALMLSQFDGKENLTKLVTIMGDRFNVLEQVFADLRDSRWIETAEGTQLDGCGEIVAQDRLISYAIALPFFGFESQSSGRGFGKARMRHSGETYLSSAKLGDVEYRKMLKAKVFKNTSTGTAEEVITSLANIFGAAKIVITEIGGAKSALVLDGN